VGVEEERYREILRARSDPSTYYALLGMKVIELEEGRSRLSMDVRRELLNAGGILHGGALASLADASIAAALATTVDHGRERMSTVEMKINYLSPVRDGRVTCSGRVIQRGRSIAVGEACVYDDEERMVAKATATFLIREK
jgi:acyl-CoA thioesterase